MTEHQRCTGCSACVSICSRNAIQMQADCNGFLYPQVDPALCVQCGMCQQVCPVSTAQMYHKLEPATFMAFAKDDSLRKVSSSGGIFSLLAQKVLLDGGVVFGCAMTPDCLHARHIAVHSPNELWMLTGSKYLQSDLAGTFPAVKAALYENKQVLFCGTPCQVAGLKTYLGFVPQGKLLTVDVICHGVPSPMVWQCYIHQQEAAAGTAVCQVSFRDKSHGWKMYSLKFTFSDGTSKETPITEDLYLQGFVRNLYLRESCYHCSFKAEAHYSDITLGDFWGVERIHADLKNSSGVSAVILHTDAGSHAFDAVRPNCVSEEVSLQDVIKSNPSYCHSAPWNRLRNAALEEIRQKGTQKTLKKYCGNSILAKCQRKLLLIAESFHSMLPKKMI